MSVNQQINLYQDVFREQALPVSARQTALAVLALIGVLALASAALYWQQQGLENRLAEQEQQKVALEERVSALRTQLESRSGDRQLQQSVEALNAELETRQRILQALSGKRFGNTGGFVEHLSGLARQRIEGLWLTGLDLHHGGTRLDLQGRSRQPEFVPNYLQKLAAEPIFAGTEFENLNISRNETQRNLVDFQLHSRVTRDKTQ